MNNKCSHCDQKGDASGHMYMYRNLKGVSTFTGFVNSNHSIIWIGKDEKFHRVISTTVQADIDFFMSEMQQYDK
jgi:hypothetical protein